MNRLSSLAAVFLLFASSVIFHSTAPALAASEAPVTLIDRYRRALEIDTHNPTLQYQLGVVLLVDDRPREAIERFQRAYPAYTDSIEMNYNLGLAYFKIDDHDSAVLYFEQAEALGALNQPDRYPLEDAFFNLGLAYMNSDLLPEAEQLFNKVLAINPDRIQIHHALGKLYTLSGQADKAVTEYELYLAGQPNDQPVRSFLYATYYNQGLQNLQEKNYPVARTAFANALRMTPDSNRVLYTLAHIDSLQGRPEAAIDALTSIYPRAEEGLRPNIRVVIFNSALALQQRKGEGDLAKAEQALQPLLQETPEDSNALFLAGNVALSAQHYDLARTRFEALLDIDPGHEGALVNLSIARKGSVKELVSKGRRHLENREYRAALDAFETAINIDPAIPDAAALAGRAKTSLEQETDVFYQQAEQAMAAGNMDQALELTRRGLANKPEDLRGSGLERQILAALQTEIEQNLIAGNGYLQQGELEQAQTAFNKVLQFDADNTPAQAGLAQVRQGQQKTADEFVARAAQRLAEGDLPAAEKAYSKALSLDPERIDAASGLSRTRKQIDATVASALRQADRASRSGDFTAARKHLEKAYALRPTIGTEKRLANLESGRQQQIEKLTADAAKLAGKEEFTAAEDLYKRALRLDPDSPQVLDGYAQLNKLRDVAIAGYLEKAADALQNQDATTALTNYRKVLNLKPANKEALSGLQQGKQLAAQKLAQLEIDAEMALREKRFDAAEKAYRQLLKLDPYHAGAKTALERISKTRQSGLQAGDEKKLYLDGIKLYTSGRYQDAIAAWQQVLLLDPDHEKARMNIEKSQRKLRMIKERTQ